MPAEICLTINERRICIPLFVEVQRNPFDPDPWHGGIDMGDLREPIRWLEAAGLDHAQQQQVAAIVQIADASAALPGRIGSQVNAMMQEQLSAMKLGDGMSLHLDSASQPRAMRA